MDEDQGSAQVEEQPKSNMGAAGLGTSLCEQCQQQKFIYRCPKCALKTCSLACSKQHKVDNNCDGTRMPYDELKKISEFSDATSIQDQKFLSDLKSSISADLAHQVAHQNNEQHQSHHQEAKSAPAQAEDSTGAENTEEQSLSSVDRYLLSACHRRHVWLKFGKDHAPDGSRHEQFSDNIMWTIGMKFVKEAATQPSDVEMKEEGQPEEGELPDSQPSKEEGELPEEKCAEEEAPGPEPAGDAVEAAAKPEEKEDEPEEGELFVQDSAPVNVNKPVTEYEYTVHGIPDSLTVSTLLRQFVKPKKVGPLVSRSDLDEAKMQPFFEAGVEGVMVYMKVPTEAMERYYCIDTSKTLLDNLRNRIVVDHPVFIVTLGSECHGFVTLSEQEAQELRDSQRAEYHKQRANSGRGGRGRGGRGGNRGGFRGGFRGGKRPGPENGGDHRGGKFPRRGRGQPRFDPLDMSDSAMRRCGAFRQENA